jgi:uncharacterized protein
MSDADLDIVLGKLQRLKPELERRGVARVAVFGSVARREVTERSDIDILVEFSRTPDLFEFVALKRWLGRRLGRRVDLVTAPALRPQMRQRVLAEAIYA